MPGRQRLRSGRKAGEGLEGQLGDQVAKGFIPENPRILLTFYHPT